MEVTSSTAQASKAEITEIAIRNFFAVRLRILKIELTIQANNPASLRSPIKTIIPTRNKITSREENFIKLSKSIVRVKSNTETPKKAKLKRKSQKKSVPNIETQNMDIERAWWELKPKALDKKPSSKEIKTSAMNLKIIFLFIV